MERRSGWELGVPARIYLPARHRAPMFIALVLVAFAFQPLGLVSFVYLGLGPTPRCGGWVPGVLDPGICRRRFQMGLGERGNRWIEVLGARVRVAREGRR